MIARTTAIAEVASELRNGLVLPAQYALQDVYSNNATGQDISATQLLERMSGVNNHPAFDIYSAGRLLNI
jgi:hypothetical protein